MQYVQYLDFEISLGCNLANEHATKCPIADSLRWKNLRTDRKMTNEQIVEAANIAYNELGFQGMICFHFYNEPMLEWERIKELISAIKSQTPNAKFRLHTNGILLTKNMSELCSFEGIYITNYHHIDFSWAVPAGIPIQWCDDFAALDERITGFSERPSGRCFNIFREIILDYYGNAHPCCHDWRGDIMKLSIHEPSGFRGIIKAYRNIRRIVGESPTMPDSAPNRCLTCYYRGKPFEPLVDEIHWITRDKYKLFDDGKPWSSLINHYKGDIACLFSEFSWVIMHCPTLSAAQIFAVELGKLSTRSDGIGDNYQQMIVELPIEESAKTMLLIEFYRASNDLDKAIQLADVLIAKDDVRLNVYFYKGICLRKKGAFKQALTCFKMEEKLYGQRADIFVQKNFLFRLQSGKVAKHTLLKQIQIQKRMLHKGFCLSPNCLWLNSEMGWLCEMEENLKDALMYFQKEDGLQPGREIVAQNINRVIAKLKREKND